MKAKLDLYRVFVEVAERKSLSKAKERLFMSQPAISQALKQLEESLNQRLFHRESRGVELTTEGKVLYQYVKDALHLIDQGEKQLDAYQQLEAGELSIGVGDTVSKYYLLPYLKAFHERYPNVHFKIVNGTTLELLPLVKSGEVDFAVCNLPVIDPVIETKPCLEVRDVFVCGEKYQADFNTPISLETLLSYPIISLEKKSNSRRFVENDLTQKGFDYKPTFEIGSYDLLVEFAKINVGVAAVVRPFSDRAINEGEVYEVPLEEPLPSRHIGLCLKKSVPSSQAANVFMSMMEKDQPL
ncbi:MAG: LysR family transcriptional regulator [Bacillota bacterium]